MISVVPTGDLGLDVLLGGGFRLVTRLPGKASATVDVRGGAGAGKTLMALQIALELAEALEGDVVVACVEILPSEYVAQVASARPDILSRVAALPEKSSIANEGPRVFCGLLTELDPAAPDLVANLEALAKHVATMGGKPVVLVVDSLIEGYGIGASAPRMDADAVMKFAAQGGYGLVLCEETKDGGASPWIFAADTVLELGVEPRERGRWIEVRKHRFGPSVPGRHELDLGAGKAPAIFPEPHAWVARDVREVLGGYGWPSGGRQMPALTWDAPLQLKPSPHGTQQLNGAFTVITSPEWGVARSLAYALLPATASLPEDMVFELDPLTREAVSDDSLLCHVPTVHGPARALRTLVEQFARSFTRANERRPRARRVIVGDLELVLLAPDALAWVEAVRVFASLVVASCWGVPVIAYASVALGAPAPASSILSAYADLHIAGLNTNAALAAQRWRRQSITLSWQAPVTSVQLSLDNLPRPGGRRPPQ